MNPSELSSHFDNTVHQSDEVDVNNIMVVNNLEVAVSFSGRRYLALKNDQEHKEVMSFSHLDDMVRVYAELVAQKSHLSSQLTQLKCKVTDLNRTAFASEKTNKGNSTASEELIAARRVIHEKFDKLGLVDSDFTALILAAQMSKKERPNSIFVIKDENIEMLTDSIVNLIKKNTAADVVKFQIIHLSDSHASFGEFHIDKTTTPPVVKYLHCDPAPVVTRFSSIITEKFRNEILPHAKIEVYDSAVILQKGTGCSYFSVDGAMMLATPQERSYTDNLLEHMQANGRELKSVSTSLNIKYVKCKTLPTRMIRGMQYIQDGPGQNGLNSLVFNTPEKDTIVNKKNESAETAIRKDVVKRPVLDDINKMRDLNLRVERKMGNYQRSVFEFIENRDITTAEFAKELDEYKIQGLVHFCESVV